MENKEKEEVLKPHVKIFNEEINSWEKVSEENKNIKKNHCHSCDKKCHHKHMGGGLFGLTVLFVGILLLLNNLGIASMEVWNYIWPFWPILLILMGIRIIFGFNRIVGFFVFIIALASFFIIAIYALIHVNSPLVYNLNLSPEFINFISQLK